METSEEKTQKKKKEMPPAAVVVVPWVCAQPFIFVYFRSRLRSNWYINKKQFVENETREAQKSNKLVVFIRICCCGSGRPRFSGLVVIVVVVGSFSRKRGYVCCCGRRSDKY